MTNTPSAEEPLLRTLSPALRELEKSVRKWLDRRHYYSVSALIRANLEGMATDLHRKAASLEMEKPLLVIVFMGGTGVGKSTLLNALAGDNIAQASFARPTTRDPVVYFHESVQSNRLDPALQHCKLVQHDRMELEQKVLVDTPDLDSNDLINREKLQQILPVADVVLYVGSQEKYHDKLGWDLFLHQRQRRAFAFVLNKWDRCMHAFQSGARPDEDLIKDLQSEGFENPRVFRTCAQVWVEKAESNGELEPDIPEGEQFEELVGWLEAGLSNLEIEAIKARGVSQLLHQLENGLKNACPPDLTGEAERTKKVWIRILAEEADGDAEVLLNTLEPYQTEIEHHFALQRQGYFRGIMAGYLMLINKMKYASSSLRERIPFAGGLEKQKDSPASWDLSTFTEACSKAASERHLDARGRALANRLLVQADEQGFPVELLSDATENAAKINWRERYARSLIEGLNEIEMNRARPSGFRRIIRGALILMADWLPLLALLAAFAMPLWKLFMEENYQPFLIDFIVPFFVLLAVLIILHILIVLLLPMRWQAIRSQFERLLEKKLRRELESVYGQVPMEVLDKLQAERRAIEHMLSEVREVTGWLKQREESASIVGLYGSQK